MERFVIESENCVYFMADENVPVLTVCDGAEIIFRTKDCFANQIQSADVAFDALDWDRINPATGPVFVENAEVGDILKVEILDITIAEQFAMVTGKDMGVAGSRLKENYVLVKPVRDGFVEFSDSVKIPIRPMIGVIGVAPAEGRAYCGTPGLHGGNMDCKEITAGVTLYLPVLVTGAKLALGDLHAVMGDGEVSVCGAEVAGEVLVRVSVLKGEQLPTPLLVNDRVVMPIASEDTVDAAVERAVLNAVDLLTAHTELTEQEAVSLLSLAANVAICQVVDPLKTVRVEIPWEILNQCGFRFGG